MENKEIIEKVNNMKENSIQTFKEFEIEIETDSDGFCIRYLKLGKGSRGISDWICSSENNVKHWKTLNGVKRYVLNNLKFVLGLENEGDN